MQKVDLWGETQTPVETNIKELKKVIKEKKKEKPLPQVTKTVEELKVTSLKSLLNNDIDQSEMEVDFSKTRDADFVTYVPSKQEIKNVKLALDKIHETKESIKVIDNNPPESANTNSKKGRYVIHAMKNKVGKQMYLSSWDDAPEQWCISLIPYATTKSRCYKLIEKANELLNTFSTNAIKSLQEKIEFEIVKLPDDPEDETYQDIVNRANKMLEESREKRNDKK